jgi:glutamate carboxypeptidase
MVDDLEALVGAESPSSDVDAIARCAEMLDSIAQRLIGQAAERIVCDGRLHLRWQFGSPARVVLIGHYDTVWPLGTREQWPWDVDNEGVARGPGAFDMKSGIVQGLHALSVLSDLDGVTLLLTSDEELGSQTSRALIEATVAGARAALVLEPSAGDDGALKIARKGTSMYEVHITGRAAHAGLEPEKGANALVELANQVLAVAALNAPELGTTVTPTVAQAGGATNVVPDRGIVHVDVRATSIDEQLRIDTALKSLPAIEPGVTVEVRGDPNRPPMEASSGRALFAQAQSIAEALGGEPLRGIAVGGGSDGNFTAAVGVATLDGLGGVGGGAHARDEHVQTTVMPVRAALLAALIANVRAQESAGS